MKGVQVVLFKIIFSMINIEKAFVTENRSVFDFYQQPGMGFYIPLYQRDFNNVN